MSLEHEEKVIEMKKYDNVVSKDMRTLAIGGAKELKNSWLKLGIVLLGIYRDKTFNVWGFERFEHYTEQELGIKKSIAINIVKNYQFTEDEFPNLLEEDFLTNCKPEDYPDMDKINVLRKAKSNKHLTVDDYRKVSEDILEKHIPLQEVKKDLTSLIKERKEESTEEVRDKRNSKSVKKFVSNAKDFAIEAGTLKILPAEVLKRVNDLIIEVEGFLDA